MIEINRGGCTRVVVLTKRFAVKLPNFLGGWSMFLHGLLANMQKSGWSRMNYEGFCPVVFSLPGGFLAVMKKAHVLTWEEFCDFDYESFRERHSYEIPAENKADSFGWLDGEIVAIDYGN